MSLSADQGALGWGAWLGDDRTGAPGPSPTLETVRIVLDKFRRTSPASPGLEILLCLFDSLLLEPLLAALALGGSAGNKENSGPACPSRPHPHPCLTLTG